MHFMSSMSAIGWDEVPGAVREAVQNLEQVLIEKRGFTANIRNTNVFFTPEMNWKRIALQRALACLSPHGV